jgi:aldehyde:ferredoxin oxidoreductase
LDTISASSTIACAMELYQNGKIKPEQVGDFPLTWVMRMPLSNGQKKWDKEKV